MHQIDEGQNRREQPADKLHQTGADQIAHAFDIGHDAGDERACAVLIVIADRKQAHMALDLAAHLGDQPLAGLGEQLGQRERGNRLHHHGSENHCDDSRQIALDAGDPD